MYIMLYRITHILGCSPPPRLLDLLEEDGAAERPTAKVAGGDVDGAAQRLRIHRLPRQRHRRHQGATVRARCLAGQLSKKNIKHRGAVARTLE